MPKKSHAQLDREIAEALANRPTGTSSKNPRRKKLKIYEIDAAIISGMDNGTMWEGSFDIPATSKKEAGLLALDILHDSPYYDDRIDPRAVFSTSINTTRTEEFTTTLEELADASIEEETRKLIEEARKVVQD